MIKVGVTGGIGSGKSSLCHHFRESGIPHYDTDLRAKEMMVSDASLVEGIKSLFGDEAYAEGELNREFIAKQIFSNDDKRMSLNSLVHPAVRRDFLAWADLQGGVPYVIVESAILFDSGFDVMVDSSIAVLAPEEIRIERVVKRDGVSEEHVRSRMAAQLTEEELHQRANYCVVNIFEEDLAGAAQRLDQLFKKLAVEAQQ